MINTDKRNGYGGVMTSSEGVTHGLRVGVGAEPKTRKEAATIFGEHARFTSQIQGNETEPAVLATRSSRKGRVVGSDTVGGRRRLQKRKH